MRALVTGASGFIGRVLAARLPGAQALPLGGADWRERCAAAALRDATVFHLAARVHGVQPAAHAEYLHDNVDKTRVLAQRAADEGAAAFVFLSSVKIHGEESPPRGFREDDPPAPRDAYARSKLEAERALAQVAARSGLRVTVVRSPLVYGARAKGNLAALMRLADSGWPLPFASLHAPRSFVHVEDLCTLLIACGDRTAATGAYLAAHGEPVSAARLVTLLREALGRPRRLWPVAPALLEAAAALAGQRERACRLTRPLCVDAGRARDELGWKARVGIEAAVREMVAAHRGVPA